MYLILLFNIIIWCIYSYYNTQSEVIKYTSVSFTSSQGFHQNHYQYNGWSSVRKLMEKDLIRAQSNPRKYYLTDQGVGIARYLYSKRNETRNMVSDDSISIDDESMCDTVNSVHTATDFIAIYDNSTTFGTPMKDNKSTEYSQNINEWKLLLLIDTRERLYNYTNLCKTDDVCYSENLSVTKNPFSDKKKNTEEQNIKSTKTSLVSQIKNLCPTINVLDCTLPVGDMVWIVQNEKTNERYVLDFIIERKCINDFIQSIKDLR